MKKAVAKKKAPAGPAKAGATGGRASTADTPAKKPPAKKSSKKAPAKEAPAKKPVAKKPTTKKPAAKKPAAKKPAAKKPAAKKPSVKKATPAKVEATLPAAPGTKKKPTRRRPLEINEAKRRKPPPPAEEAADGTPRRKSSKFNPTAVTKPVKRKKALELKKYKVPVGRRAASARAGDAPKPAPSDDTRPGSVDRAASEHTPEQLRKVKTGISKKRLMAFREQLLEHRRALVGDVAGLDAARGHDDGDSHVPLHMADVGSENYEREFNLMLQETDRKLLKDIDAALVRIDDGTYGVCLDTCTPIGLPRLEIKPWARYGIEAIQRREREAGYGGHRRR
ncbi:hypothetical protein PSMK_25130 [Phycisphaera mikurensis NBRC 102666]|uniref:Uncharacterized protein n=1 Tax=Phycisphaera mikurensis (strain NBRC 102666 / KCTC 22515 / FYK2301M01) TaxID=1142394 RepID=I0IHD4_PHYMF|nr:hypothetical protein PSMK_25130 [Phycisphaera mikurensis NBRC 102666]